MNRSLTPRRVSGCNHAVDRCGSTGRPSKCPDVFRGPLSALRQHPPRRAALVVRAATEVPEQTCCISGESRCKESPPAVPASGADASGPPQQPARAVRRAAEHDAAASTSTRWRRKRSRPHRAGRDRLANCAACRSRLVTRDKPDRAVVGENADLKAARQHRVEWKQPGLCGSS